MVHVLSYSRISSDTAKDAHGVADHHVRNHQTAARLGWAIVGELTDNDVSAAYASIYRADFEALIKALLLGRLDDGTQVDGVIVTEQLRLARNHTDWERFTDALTCQPGRVCAIDDAVRDPYSDAFELLGAINTSLGKSEVRKIRARTKASHRSRAERGAQVGGSRPFGWSVDDRKLLDSSEADIARGIVAEFLAGRSLYGITSDLQARGITTTKGNQWTSDGLRKYLANPRLCGWRLLGGEIVRDDSGDPVVGEWEPLISTDKWLEIERLLGARRRKGKLGADTRKHLLSGFLRCGKCGASLRSMPTKRADVRGGLLYACPAKTAGGCGGVARNALVVEAFLVEAVLSRAERVTTDRRERGPWPRQQDYEDLRGRRGKLTEAWSLGNLGDEVYFEGVALIESQLRELKRERTAWDARLAVEQRVAGSVRDEWEGREGQLDWRRAFLADHLSSVVVLPVGGGRRKFDPNSFRIMWAEN